MSGAPPPSTEASLSCASAFAVFKLAAVVLRRSRGVGLPGLVEEALQDIGTIGCRDGVHRESPPNDTHWVSMGDIGSGQENFSGIRKKLG